MGVYVCWVQNSKANFNGYIFMLNFKIKQTIEESLNESMGW